MSCWGFSGPVKIADLAGGETDQRIAVAQCVIEEREGMLLGKRRQPQRKLRQINGHLVLVHAIETALGYDAAGMEQFVLVRRNRRKGIGAAPGFEQDARPTGGRFPPGTRQSPWRDRRS